MWCSALGVLSPKTGVGAVRGSAETSLWSHKVFWKSVCFPAKSPARGKRLMKTSWLCQTKDSADCLFQRANFCMFYGQQINAALLVLTHTHTLSCQLFGMIEMKRINSMRQSFTLISLRKDDSGLLWSSGTTAVNFIWTGLIFAITMPHSSSLTATTESNLLKIETALDAVLHTNVCTLYACWSASLSVFILDLLEYCRQRFSFAMVFDAF